MGTLDLDAIRAEIAKKCNVLLSKEDPIFLAVLLNEQVLTYFLSEMKSLSSEARNASIAVVAQQVDVAKVAAAKLINDTAGFVAGEIRREVKAAVEASLSAANQAVVFSRRWSLLAWAAAAVALTIAASSVGVLIAILLKH